MNTTEVFSSLREEHSGIGALSLLETIHRDSLPAGEIKIDNNKLRDLAEVSYREKLFQDCNCWP
jgi:hypothetical protein